jgi:AbrB family looped-hinge helix DNA binding protein
MHSTTVTTKGQVVIPEEIRKLLHISPGTKIQVTVENGKIVMQIDDYQQKLQSFRSKVKTHLKAKKLSSVTDEQMNQTRNSLWQNRNN